MLATDSRCGEPRLAAVLRWRALGVHRRWLVLAIGLFVGLGAVPLRSLVPPQSMGMVLGARYRLGTVVGDLEILFRLLRVGAITADSLLHAGFRI